MQGIILQDVKAKTDKIEWNLTFKEFNPWLDMAETERSNMKNLREKVFTALGVDKSTVRCWVTNKPGDVKVAHILPDSCKDKIFEHLKIPIASKNEVHATTKNFLVLDPAIENAFDHLNLSFIPQNPLRPSELSVKVWDNSILVNMLSVSGESLTIANVVNAPLHMPTGWQVFKRALSYQALCAYIYHKHRNTGSLPIEEPVDFSSEFEGKDEARKNLASLFNSNVKTELSEEYDD